ncbi:hypothetical protein CP965_02460 [Halarcobacter mediterraneus]|uniref:Prokaryotic metallothionein n=1 Tax=Halarcobacter mediterraneus TaxID=2023153 RepID=A0A4Q1AX55_9BACT|nr:PP0621 family protein [Halarcobacter mediterraneus]RXK14328.1 hypothetical protein CP965_02460 [Halarcobacter mediterraneus]
MILKFLVAAIVLFLIYIVLFKKDREKEVKTNKKDEKIEDIMVECPTCGTFVSKKEAILSNGQFYCSKECLINK